MEIEIGKCKWCGNETQMTISKECNKCWELRHRIQIDVKLSERILKAIKKGEI